MKRAARITCLAALACLLALLLLERRIPAVGRVDSVLAIAAAGAAALSMAYTLLAGAVLARFFGRPVAEPAAYPPVTVVKPLCGDERALAENLASFFEQDYPGPVQYVFGTLDAGDPAHGVVAAVRRSHPDADVATVADPRLHGPNRKVSNLINMLPAAKHDILVFADSDVGVARNYLRAVVGELEKPGVGLVTCVYYGKPDPGFWPRISALATTYQFMPSAVAGVALGLAQPCFGQTIAMRRATLERIGGFAPFAHHLAEDHAIGVAARRTGARVSIPPFAISHACVEASLARLVKHELRWSRTIRAVDPLGHAGSVLIHPLPLALLAVLFSGGAPWAWAAAGAALASRAVLKLATDRALHRRGGDLWLLPVWDLLAFGIFLGTYLSNRVEWRGVRFDVSLRGFLSASPGSAGAAWDAPGP